MDFIGINLVPLLRGEDTAPQFVLRGVPFEYIDFLLVCRHEILFEQLSDAKSREDDLAVMATAARILKFPAIESLPELEMTSAKRDSVLNTYCIAAARVGPHSNTKFLDFEEYFSFSHEFLQRIEDSRCEFHENRIFKITTLRWNRHAHCISRQKHEVAIFEADEFLKHSPLNHAVVYMLSMKAQSLIVIGKFRYAKIVFDRIRVLHCEHGLGLGFEAIIEHTRAMLLLARDRVAGNPKYTDFRRSISENLAKRLLRFGGQAFPPRFDPSIDMVLNVDNLVQQIRHASIVLGKDYDLAVNLPFIGAIRSAVDTLCFISFSDKVGPNDSFVAFRTEPPPAFNPAILPCHQPSYEEESARVAVLRYSDSLKSPLLSRFKTEQLAIPNRIWFAEHCVSSSTTALLHDLTGLIIAYHVIAGCPVCPDEEFLIRWVIRDGSVLHSDRVKVSKRSEWTLQWLSGFFSSLFRSCPNAADLMRKEHRSRQTSVCLALYRLLLDGLEEFLVGSDHIVFVPDRHLHRIPFGCLLHGNGSYLIDRYSFSISPSLRMLLINAGQMISVRQKKSSLCRALVCGNALQMKDDGSLTSSPALAISAVVEDLLDTGPPAESVVVLSQKQWNTGLFEKSCRMLNPRSVHIVAHGTSLQDHQTRNPLEDVFEEFRIQGLIECSLDEDNLLASRLSTFDLSGTSLVFLNCCESALGKDREVGLLGFNRACFEAGCPSVISTLWSVKPSVSSFLARKFYHSLFSGHDKAKSLRGALMGLRLSTCPAIWGAYQLYGSVEGL